MEATAFSALPQEHHQKEASVFLLFSTRGQQTTAWELNLACFVFSVNNILLEHGHTQR